MDSDKILQIGKASIFRSYPDWLPVKVGSNYNHVSGPANPIDGRPVPTNKWFSPLFWWKYDLDINATPAGTPLRPMPALLQMYTWGLMLAYRHNPEHQAGNCGWPDGKSDENCSNNTFWPFDTSPNSNFNGLVISVDKLLVDKEKNPFFVKASAFGDWDATLEWDDGERRLQLTGLAGGPMLYGTATGGELEFQLPFGDSDHPITFYDGQGKSLGEAYNGASPGPNLAGSKDGVLGMAFKTKYGDTIYYAIFAPRGTTWSFTQSTNPPNPPPRGGDLSKLKSTNLAAGNQPVHFTVAALPLPPKGVDFPLNALKAFADAAGFHVGGTVFSWDGWDTTKSTITAHYEFPVTERTGGLPTKNPSVITTLFKPHQALLGEADGSVAYVLGEDNKPYSYNSPRGPLKLVRLPVDTTSKTARYSITYPYYGYVPALPDLSLSSEELSALKGYLSADSRQTPAATTDFLNNQQPDAYAAGTKIYYKLMQTIFWLQQLQQVDGIPNFRGSGQFVDKQEAIKTLVSFLKTDLETFFSATRPPALAYQWHFINPDANDVGKFTQTIAEPKLPQIFPCKENDKDDTTCNPLGDPLLKEQGTCWKLTQQDLIDAQAAGKNPYLVLRGLDFTVNEFAKTGPAIDTLLHFVWKQARTDLKMADIVMYVFYALSSKKADPGKPEDWTQCVWINEEGQGKIKLKVHSNTGIGNPIFNDEETPWHVRSVTYNGTSTYAPEQRMQADKYDVMLVFDCGADCENFPLLCAGGTNPPNVSDPSWDGWEITLGPVHFEGKPYKFIAYNSVWNSLLGNVSWYGSIENLADHHFGWGYLIKAAALVAQFDTSVEPDTKKPWWDIEHGWGGIVNLLIRDVMDWRKPDETDPDGLTFARCKYLNPVEGHMYADGSGNSADGNNEESSSEAVNFANACIEWGAVTGQDEIRDIGILLHSMYAQAVPMYWFNVDGDVLPSTTASAPFPLAGQITGAGNKHDTYFSNGPVVDAGCASRNSDVVAIEILPVTAGTLRLTLLTPQLKVAWDTVTNAGGPYCAPDKDHPLSTKCYVSTLLSFQSLFDAASAKASFLQRANPQDSFTKWYNCNALTQGLKQPEDHSYATTYAFILSLERLGAAKAECVSSPDSNPFYMPMADGSLLIYNPTSAERAFRIRGVSVTVPSLRCLHVDVAGVPVDSVEARRA